MADSGLVIVLGSPEKIQRFVPQKTCPGSAQKNDQKHHCQDPLPGSCPADRHKTTAKNQEQHRGQQEKDDHQDPIPAKEQGKHITGKAGHGVCRAAEDGVQIIENVKLPEHKVFHQKGNGGDGGETYSNDVIALPAAGDRGQQAARHAVCGAQQYHEHGAQLEKAMNGGKAKYDFVVEQNGREQQSGIPVGSEFFLHCLYLL